ncbi:MAG: menaquinone biosynthesis protein [Frankia sp.]|nr:menaquinone biosynthesis protein [Frankia sp.]
MPAAADAENARPRVGHIQFLNCVPLYDGLVRSAAIADLGLRQDTPDALSDALVAGELDIGPISSVEYLRHADDLLLLPDLAVGSNGRVLSVNIVSTVDLVGLDDCVVALASTSRTSALLAQLLLEDRYAVRPRYVTAAPDLDRMLHDAAAAVLIGDAALYATHQAPARGLRVYDLGAEWREWTGLPMVFAVWAVRREFAAAHPGAAKEIHDLFVRSLETSLADLDGVAVRAVPRHAFDAATLAEYFRALDFSLGERQLAGLREFARRAAARGALPDVPALEFAGV